MTFRHKCSDEAGKLERVAVIGDGKSGFHGWKLVELGDVSVELSHGGPDFMGTELDQRGLEIARGLSHAWKHGWLAVVELSSILDHRSPCAIRKWSCVGWVFAKFRGFLLFFLEALFDGGLNKCFDVR